MSWLDALLQVGGQIGGALLSSNANQKAADTVAQANERAAQIFTDAQAQGFDRYKALIDQAMGEATAYNERARGVYQGMADQSAPAVAQLRQTAFSNPYTLTPQQQTAREGVVRDANARLAASGLRGAGRAGVATVNKAAQDFDNSAWSSNRSRADAANNTLFGANQNAENNIAATDRQTGATRANMVAGAATAANQASQNTGAYTAGTTRETGQTEANSGTADANLWGGAIGALSNVIANNQKQLFGGYGQYNPGQV
jgi:hypothetical protein